MTRKVNEEQQAAVTERIGEPTTSHELPVHNNGHNTEKQDPGSRPVIGTTKKSTFSRKLEANRRNALKSTGPKTPIGKRMVSRNALKHGFFSKYLLIQHPDGKEDRTEYEECYAAFRKHYQPLGFLEELWLEKIAVWSWRLRRLIRCERGQITRGLAEHRCDIQDSKAARLEQPELGGLGNPELDLMTDDLFLPSNEDLDKLLRYEAMINKQLNHALAELERLQRRRNGESVLASISAEISRHD